MQKNVLLAIALSLAVLFLAPLIFRTAAPAPLPSPGTPSVSTGTRSAPVAQPYAGTPAAPRPGGRPVVEKYPDAADEKISNGQLDLTFAVRGGSLRAAEAFGCLYHPAPDRTVTGDPGHATDWVEGMAGALAIDVFGGAEEMPDLTKSNWKLTRTGDTIVAEYEGDGWVFTKTVKLSTDPAFPYHADIRFALRNVSAAPGSTLTLEVVGPIGARPGPSDPSAGVVLGQTGEVEDLTAAAIHKLLAENPRAERRATVGNWEFIGARADFYLGALIPSAPLPADASVGFRSGMRADLHGGPAAPAAAATFRLPISIPPAGEETGYSFRYFAGPNRHALLTDPASPYYPLHLETKSRSWFSLGWISRFMAWLLGALASTGMGYGLAVISLTILVRGALFPLSRKSQISMRLHAQKMQRLKPKMDAIKEKHKDPKKQQELTMKLMREEKVSLLPGGCLLAFAQMPIWISLYGVLQSTFEMRHASFLWVKDLTGPDHLFHMSFFAGTWFPEWFNLLPILMMATWYTSAAMQPLPDDPQQASTAKMMRWMPVLMGLMLYSYASGLTLYMTMSALWSIGETWYIRKRWLSKLELALK